MEQPKQLESEKVYYQPHLLISDKSEIRALRDDCGSFLAKLNNLRRGLFKRLDDVVKSIKEIILRQDERDLEMAKLKARIDKLEAHQYSSRNMGISRSTHVVGRKKPSRPIYMMGR